MADYERIARIGNLIAEAVNDVVVAQGRPGFEHRAFTPSWPVCAHSFVSAYFVGYRQIETFEGRSRRPDAVYGIDMARVRTNMAAVLSGFCSTADYYGDVIACTDPLPAPVDDTACVAIADPDAPHQAPYSTAEVHNLTAVDAEIVRQDLEHALCSALLACGLRTCRNVDPLYESSVDINDGRFIGFRWRWAVGI